MVKKPKKGATYWLAGHHVYADLHVVPVFAKRVYDDDLSIDGSIDVTGVPVNFRSRVSPETEKISTIIYPDDLFSTREAAARELTILLFHRQSELSVARMALELQYAIIRAEKEAAEVESGIREHPNKLRTDS